ncbi:MAG: TM0106 family RecB-like putative nuclease [Prochloraceae cyanobacterium]
MKAKVTQDVLESYIHCKYKGYLKLIDQSGIKSDYENLRIKLRSEVKRNAISKIYAQATDEQIINDVVLRTSILEQNPPFVLNTSVEDGYFLLVLDGIEKVATKRQEHSFYAPMFFYEGSRIRKEQRLFLELVATFLFKYQTVIPVVGIVWHGKECKQTTVRLNTDSRKVKQIQLELKKMCVGEEVPRLVLNNHCQMCEFQNHCYQQAHQEDNLSLIRGISEKEIKSFNRQGILTVTQLAHTFRPRRKRKNAAKESKRRYHALQALAIRDEKIYVLGTVQVPDSPVCIYLDVESDPDIDFVYLIGLVIVENGSEKRYSFWADSKEQEAQIFEQFVNEVTRREEFIIFCYGGYERAFIRKMKKASLDKALIERILNALVNTLSLIYAHIYFPTYSNGLKDIGKYLGFSWTESDASGLQSIVWRAKWETSYDDSWKYKLLTYNIEDCLALKIVTETIRRILATTSSEKESFVDDVKHLSVGFVEDLEKLSDYHKWKKINLAQPEFEFINRRAYFDYQRERVYVRSSKAIKKAKSTKAPSPNRSLPASKRIMIVAAQCPICQSEDVIDGIKKPVRTQEPRVKRAFDIIFTPTGVRRRVIECRTSVHKCLKCNEEFIPIEHQRLDRHFHGLKSWAMFQHVEYQINLQVLSKMLEEFFGVRLAYNEIHMLKSLMARYYEITYQRLLADLIAGQLLHVDETEVELQNRKGYVWVFTNLEEVVYLYRPSREGGFLHELLADFKGVLVSDFYAAYDGIECPQQKCLIHLIRDINQDLLNNPFDEELKSITQPFGVLLREIVTTIDEHGLRKKYLMRHALAVEDFFHSIDNRLTSSDVAQALRLRLIKNRDKLFAFIQYDGIPWNNNNAEHAIKQFAYYRENYHGIITESGLENYLVLLSICQTCHYKGIDFLKFLLSKEQDIDAFNKRKKQRRKLSSIELYPEGFVPPSRP